MGRGLYGLYVFFFTLEATGGGVDAAALALVVTRLGIGKCILCDARSYFELTTGSKPGRFGARPKNSGWLTEKKKCWFAK